MSCVGEKRSDGYDGRDEKDGNGLVVKGGKKKKKKEEKLE